MCIERPLIFYKSFLGLVEDIFGLFEIFAFTLQIALCVIEARFCPIGI